MKKNIGITYGYLTGTLLATAVAVGTHSDVYALLIMWWGQLTGYGILSAIVLYIENSCFGLGHKYDRLVLNEEILSLGSRIIPSNLCSRCGKVRTVSNLL